MLSVAGGPAASQAFHEPIPAVASRALAPGCLKSHAVRRPWAQRTAAVTVVGVSRCRGWGMDI